MNSLPGNASPAERTLEICHIANSGFLISDGGEGVLIDGVLGKKYKNFQHPTETLNRKIETSSGKFSNVSLVLITHFHGDHFDGPAILRHLRQNTKTRYVMPAQALTLLEEEGLTEKEKKRVFFPPFRTGEWQQNPDFSNLKIIPIGHSNYKDVENFGFLLNFAGKTFFHPGDIEEGREILKFFNPETRLKTDFLFIPYWSLAKPENLAGVEKAFDPGWVVPMHLYTDEVGKNLGWTSIYGGWEAFKKRIFSALPNTISLPGEMDCFIPD